MFSGIFAWKLHFGIELQFLNVVAESAAIMLAICVFVYFFGLRREEKKTVFGYVNTVFQRLRRRRSRCE